MYSKTDIYSSQENTQLESLASSLTSCNLTISELNESHCIIKCGEQIWLRFYPIPEQYRILLISPITEKLIPMRLLPQTDKAITIATFEGKVVYQSKPYPFRLRNKLSEQIKILTGEVESLKKNEIELIQGFYEPSNISYIHTNLTDIVLSKLNPTFVKFLKHKLFLLKGKTGCGKQTMAIACFKKMGYTPLMIEDESDNINKIIEKLLQLKIDCNPDNALIISEVLGNHLVDSIGTNRDLIRLLTVLSLRIPVIVLSGIKASSPLSSPLKAVIIDLFASDEIEEIYTCRIAQLFCPSAEILYYPETQNIGNPLYTIIMNSK